MPLSTSSFVTLGELILISMFSLTLGNVRSFDGRSIERTWNSSANMKRMSCISCERRRGIVSVMAKGSTGHAISFSHQISHARQNITPPDTQSRQS